jgi:hypothetical protein
MDFPPLPSDFISTPVYMVVSGPKTELRTFGGENTLSRIQAQGVSGSPRAARISSHLPAKQKYLFVIQCV